MRLWEQDAAAAVAAGRPGLAVLSPLMRGATAALVERAAAVVLAGPTTARQADLLTILGVFAAPLLEPERFVQLISKERLMASELISYLFKDELEQALVQMVEDTVSVRFPDLPADALAPLREVHDAQRLRALHRAVLQAPDAASAERLLRDAAAAAQR